MKLLIISPKNVYAAQRFAVEARNLRLELMIMDVAELVSRDYEINPAGFDALYIRQAYVHSKELAKPEHLQNLIKLAGEFRETGKVVVDEAIADGDLGQGKFEILQRLQQQGIPVPQTRLLSETVASDLHFPAIAKWNYGFGAKHTYLLKSTEDLHRIQRQYSADQIMLQEFVPAEFEYKVITIGYQSLPVILKLKTNNNKFLPDLTAYQVLSKSDAPLAVDLAEKASRFLQRELAKVDILQSGDRLYLLEVNRWPGLQYFEKVSGYNLAQDFLRYIGNRL